MVEIPPKKRKFSHVRTSFGLNIGTTLIFPCRLPLLRAEAAFGQRDPILESSQTPLIALARRLSEIIWHVSKEKRAYGKRPLKGQGRGLESRLVGSSKV